MWDRNVRHTYGTPGTRSFPHVGQQEFRAFYDALLADPAAPAVFPFGGFVSLLVAGERSRDGQTGSLRGRPRLSSEASSMILQEMLDSGIGSTPENESTI